MFRPLSSARVAYKIKEINKPQEGVQYIINRNPRNLEKLRIAYKPIGYGLEKEGRSFWHKLEIDSSKKYVTAILKHFENGAVIKASTSEWSIKKQLLKTNDTSAYVNLAKVFAQRCLEAGLIEMRCDIKPLPNGKLEKFLNVLQENGISLEEPNTFKPHRPWGKDRPEKPWEVHE